MGNHEEIKNKTTNRANRGIYVRRPHLCSGPPSTVLMVLKISVLSCLTLFRGSKRVAFSRGACAYSCTAHVRVLSRGLCHVSSKASNRSRCAWESKLRNTCTTMDQLICRALPDDIHPPTPSHLRSALHDEEHVFIRPSRLVDVVALEPHTPLSQVHEPQEVHGIQAEGNKELLENPRL